ncbi:hypothetical protein EZV62_017378 [Acer yangbiense]|uniref:Mannosyl-oligosaccharide glucosidase n=1 Tax=Acer yangbiense TaxID=1000413 RepID=A0A5C7HH93_9ROSI|nr:hypothetical protein EZV62_017378 [Acer yangbiense]
MFPVNRLARSPNCDTLMSFSAIGCMVPKNPFSPRSSDNKRVQSCKDADSSPERLLLLSLKQTSEGSEHIELGMPPNSLFFDKSTILNLSKPCQFDGISPDRRLFDKSKKDKFFIFLMDSGMLPFRRFLERSRFSNIDILLPMSIGIGQEFLYMSKVNNSESCPISSAIIPSIKLKDRSRWLKCDQFPNLGSEPMKELWERSRCTRSLKYPKESGPTIKPIDNAPTQLTCISIVVPVAGLASVPVEKGLKNLPKLSKMAGGSRRSARSRIKSSTDADEDEPLRNPRINSKNRRDSSSSLRIFNVRLEIVLGFCILSFLVIFFLIHRLVNTVEENQRPRVVTPFPAPKLMDLPMFQGDHKESLYWGTYRPHVYFGVRARTPRSLVAGLMWLGVKDGRYYMRHVCQDSDELSKYGWTQHNGRDFGHQVLVDQDMTLATSFVKTKGEGSGYGGDWAVRLGVQNEESQWNNQMQSSGYLFFYLADEDGNALSLSKDSESSLLAFGSRLDIGDWQLHLKAKDDLGVHYSGFRTPHIHNLSDLVQEELAVQARMFNRLQLSDTSDDSSNILIFQISATIPLEADIAFVAGTGSRVEERVSSLTGTLLTNLLKEKQGEFDSKFEKCFNLADKPDVHTNDMGQDLDSESVIVGKAAIGNMLGGIGYFYGQSKISLPKSSKVKSHENFVSYWPAELYTAVPSRPFFPRGFLWDEGFHQLLIRRWDVHICLDIIGHWLDLMNVDGWIPREQILGAEALSKVPEEFVLQHPTNGNPPTLFLVLRELVYGVKKNKFTATESNEISSFLERALVRLEAWFQWFNTTQSGKEMGTYYWHGRDNSTTRELNPKSLSSGLDDYPRASHPSEEERHLDLRCWMLLAADSLHSITELFESGSERKKRYGSTAKLLSDFEILNQVHFDAAYGAYFDFGNHTEKVRLSWKEKKVENNYPTRELIREVLKRPELRLVPHIGYVSLFPFMEKIIPPESWILDKQLDLISNRSILWTDYGLRSLAKTSTLYMKRNTEHDPPYWRGPIWMNMNYRILSALHHYSQVNGPYKDRAKVVYSELRSNLIGNVVHNYHQTGFLWEQYDQTKGKGKGARLFTGWTSLVLLIMAEAYAEG